MMTKAPSKKTPRKDIREKATPTQGPSGAVSPEETELSEALEQATKSLSEEKRRLLVHTLSQQSFFQGPFPPPDVLQGYEEILPGSAERVFTLTEKEQQHRHRLEEEEIRFLREHSQAEDSRLRLGQVSGFLIIAASLSLSTWLALEDRTIVALAMLSAPVFAAIGKLIRPRGQHKPPARQDTENKEDSR